jgi:membrane protein
MLYTAAPWAALAVIAALWNRLPPRSPGKRLKPAARKSERPPGMSLEAQMSPAGFEAAEPGRGREAEAPHQIPLRGWRDVLFRTFTEVNQDRLSIVAGGVTFYSLLAIFPAVGVFVSLYGLFADVSQVNAQLANLSLVIPDEALAVVGDQMTRLAGGEPATLSAAFVISLLLSVWSANAGMTALFAGLNVAYDEAERRNLLVQTALTYAFTLGLLVFLTLVSALLVVAPLALDVFGLTSRLLLPLRWLTLWAVAAGAFTIVYRYGPSRARARWRWVTWGAVLAATFWLVGSLAFSWYVNHMAHFDVTYGPLGAVIGFMAWIWFSVMVVLIGAELNAEIEHQTALDSTTGPPEPMGERGAAMADSVGVAFQPHVPKSLSHAWSRMRGR